MSKLAVPIFVAGSLVAGCGSSSDAVDRAAETSIPATTTTATTVAPDEPGREMRGLRYCEILLLSRTDAGLVAEVYNTYPLNDCPVDSWTNLDTAAIAAEAGVPLALTNGPRYWLMDSVEKADRDTVITREFGGLAMNRYAQVVIGDPETAGQPYAPQSVDRKAIFTFEAGRTIYVLTAIDGTEYVMQSWSQQRDPALAEADLATLGSRLALPEGWTYTTRVLTDDLVVDTTSRPAQVLQDELLNSYSLIP
ncbi:MAG: hypothetical protein ACKO84_00250 [Actinomycetota bacterium]